MPPSKSEIAERIEALQRDVAYAVTSSELSLAEIGRRSGYTRASISNVVNGNRRLSLEAALRIGAVVGFDVEISFSRPSSEAVAESDDEEGLLLAYRELSVAGQRYVRDQLELIRYFPPEKVPVLGAEVRVMRQLRGLDDD